jgi:polar amino acid transport system permease protein
VEGIIPYAPALLQGARQTIILTAAAGTLCVVVAVVAGLSRYSPWPWLRAPAAAFIEFFRGSSAVIQLFWVFFVLPSAGVDLTPFTAGIVVLGLNAGSYGAEIVRGAITSVPKGQVEASLALNLPPVARLFKVLMPQALILMLPPMKNLLIELMKGTSLVSLLGISELTFAAQSIRARTGDTTTVYVLVLLMYFTLAVVISRSMDAATKRASEHLGLGERSPEKERPGSALGEEVPTSL